MMRRFVRFLVIVGNALNGAIYVVGLCAIIMAGTVCIDCMFYEEPYCNDWPRCCILFEPACHIAFPEQLFMFEDGRTTEYQYHER